MDNLWITFQECLGIKPTPAILRALCTWCERVGYDVIDYALMEAAAAPNPSWRYAQAILVRCEGLHINKRPGETITQAIIRARQIKEAREAMTIKDRLRDQFPSY